MTDIIPGITDIADAEQVSEQPTEPKLSTTEVSDIELKSTPDTVLSTKICGNCGNCIDCITEALIAKVQTVDEFDTNLKIMIYSDPGARKSSWLSGIPNSLTVDLEKGFLAVKALKQHHPELVSPTAKLLPYKSFFTVEALVQSLSLNQPGFDWVEVLSIDSMSEMHKRGYAEILEREFRKGLRESQFKSDANDNGSDHGENNEHIRRMVSSLRDLNRNIVLTSHARYVQQKDKSFKVYPDFSEKLANTLVGIMDVVAFIEKIETPTGMTARWHFQSSYAMVKERIGINQPYLDNPTYSDLYDYYIKL